MSPSRKKKRKIKTKAFIPSLVFLLLLLGGIILWFSATRNSEPASSSGLPGKPDLVLNCPVPRKFCSRNILLNVKNKDDPPHEFHAILYRVPVGTPILATLGNTPYRVYSKEDLGNPDALPLGQKIVGAFTKKARYFIGYFIEGTLNDNVLTGQTINSGDEIATTKVSEESNLPPNAVLTLIFFVRDLKTKAYMQLIPQANGDISVIFLK